MEKERLDEIAADYYGHDSAGNVTFNHEGFLTHVDAERGKVAVTPEYGIEWVERYTRFESPQVSDPLFLSAPTIPEGVALVPPEKPLPDLMMASYHEAVGWNACRDAMLAAAQGERNV